MDDRSRNSGCIGILLNLFGVGPSAPLAKTVPDDWVPPGTPEKARVYPYGLKDAFLSPAEISFFHVVKGVLPPGQYLISKVRLADLFYVKMPHLNRTALNSIARKHVDLVVCDAGTMQPLLGIELDDASHLQKGSQESDEFKDQAFAAAGLPLLRVVAGRSYNPREIAEMIQRKLGA